MPLSDTEEYSLRSIAALGSNMQSQITVGNVTLPKAVLNTANSFEVYLKLPYVNGVTLREQDLFL